MVAWSILSKYSWLWPIWGFPEIDLEKEYNEAIEESKTVFFEMVGVSRENYEMLTPFGIDKLQYSSLTKLLNVITYVQRFVDKIKKKQSSFDNLKCDESQKAEKLWIKYVQQKHFMIKERCITKEKNQLNLNIHLDRITFAWKVTECRHTS